jgi:hypothetical protein
MQTPGDLRDWRQTVPLAALIGAALGWTGRPVTARAGFALAALALAAFAGLFALGHVLISAAPPMDALGASATALIGPAGGAALVLGAAAGWAAGRAGPS